MKPDARSPTVRDVAGHRGRLRAALDVLIDNFWALPIGVLAALVWANTAGLSYFRFAHALRFVVNDVGMVFFVALVTEEALEAVMPGGALHRWRRTLLPIAAALGGVLGATAIYVLYLRERSEFMLVEGWPVAAAQDVVGLDAMASQAHQAGFTQLILRQARDIFHLFTKVSQRDSHVRLPSAVHRFE